MTARDAAPVSRASFLWVTEEASHDPRTGGALRSFELVSALAAASDVHVISLGPLDVPAYVAATGVAGASVVPLRGRSRVAAKVAGWVRGWPATFAATYDREVATRARLASESGQVLVFEHLRTVANRPRDGRCVVALQNLDSSLVGLEEGGSPARRLLRAVERSLTQRQERLLAADPEVLLTAVSETEAAALGPGTVVVPNGTRLPAEVPAVPRGGSVLFVGSLTYAPNREAVGWWAERIWPHAEGVPPLTVVGLGGSEALGQLAGHPAVHLLGTVPDVGVHLAAASVVAVPLVSGAGTKLKVLEAMAWGRPVVTTSKGAEGLPIVDGVHAMVVDDPAAFAQAIRLLLADAELAGRLGRSGRELAQAHSWDAIAARFVEVSLRQAALPRP